MTDKINSFKDLHAWQEGHKFVVQIYEATSNFPLHEQFGLSNQLRRAAVSITSNIAEGFGRQSVNDKVHYYIIARGSLNEVQSQREVAKDVGYIKGGLDALDKQAVIVHRIINGLIKSIRIQNA